MTGDDEILRRVVRGDQVAWTALFLQYSPVVERIARTNRSMGSYRESDDDVRNVMAHVFERLRRHDYRALRMFSAWRDRSGACDTEVAMLAADVHSLPCPVEHGPRLLPPLSELPERRAPSRPGPSAPPRSPPSW